MYHHHGHDHADLDPARQTLSSEVVEFRTVGIDIGSSTSHLMVSRVKLRRIGVSLSSRFVVTEREVLFRSPVLLTPFLSGEQVDLDTLSRHFQDWYGQCGVTQDDIDVGAVIITGVAAERKNAERIVTHFAASSGRFVCATAGPYLECQLAAHGSGAVRWSQERRTTVLNVDMGGGTTKLTVVREGRIEAMMAIGLGSRLVSWDAAGRITRIEQAAYAISEGEGMQLVLGAEMTVPQRQRFADAEARILFEVLDGHLSTLGRSLCVTAPAAIAGQDTLLFSGGTSEFVYGRETRDFGDLGSYVGNAIRAEIARRPRLEVVDADERLRATVVGASQYTVQVSGSTIYLSDPGVLPLHNVPVVPVSAAGEAVSPADIRRAMASFDTEDGDGLVALALPWLGELTYSNVRRLTQALEEAVPRALCGSRPLVLMFDQDVASAVGHLLAETGARCPLIAIDQVVLNGLNYVDVGALMAETQSVPIVVKSLVF